MQVMTVTTSLLSDDELSGISSIQFIGGCDTEMDHKRWNDDGGNIVIATPGRLLEMMNIIPLKKLEVLILDEADRLLDFGFQNALTQILEKLPKQRRTVRDNLDDDDALGVVLCYPG